ncbi:MAG TPA: hypothetical protein VFS12_00770 [Terriglobia bacterium]|nr:hypothetical protein [Terriglobia bacterium]
MKATRTVITPLILGLLMAVVASAQANRLQDLVGARAGQAEGDLESRGYVQTHASSKDGSSYGYWWSRDAKKCVVVRTADGRYASITDTTNADCNQKEPGSGMSTGAKVGIAAGAGAAAAIGAAILVHKSHHHDDEKHYEDTNREGEYERGYRDGLYNSAYHNYSRSDDYAGGYEAGVAERRRQTSYSTGRGGYRPHVNFSDLVGARASSGESEMESRGFRNVDGFKTGTTSYTIWYNNRTRQCIQVATADGRYDSVTDIETHPKCR